MRAARLVSVCIQQALSKGLIQPRRIQASPNQHQSVVGSPWLAGRALQLRIGQLVGLADRLEDARVRGFGFEDALSPEHLWRWRPLAARSTGVWLPQEPLLREGRTRMRQRQSEERGVEVLERA